MCLGYYNEPEITAREAQDGWLRTGDIFCKDKDGFFYFRSRVDDMFSCGGENVYPKEVENLLFAHPDVVNAVVAPVPHPVKGFVPAAMVIAREGSAVTRGRSSRPIASTRGRPIRIRASSTSSRRCRSTAPARSTAASVQAKLNAAYAAKSGSLA